MSKNYQKSFPAGKNAGFTLIELLVVVLIIGILAAVALPQYQTAVDKAKYTELQTLVSAVVKAEELYYMANGKYTDDFSELDISVPYKGQEGMFWSQNGDYYLSTDGKATASGYVFGKYMPANVLYLVYLNASPKAGTRQCRSQAADAPRAEKICKSMGGVYAGAGPFQGKIYNLP